MGDDFDLDRFVQAQDSAGAYEQALGELRNGRKTSHWMWFVFPQVAGLGHSPTAQRYAISGRDEARAYLSHPVLGPRLRECTRALVGQRATATAIMGAIDALKLRSSMTLFARADPGDEAFRAVLDQFFQGEEDEATTSRI